MVKTMWEKLILHEDILAQFSVYSDQLVFLQVMPTFCGKLYKSDIIQPAYSV